MNWSEFWSSLSDAKTTLSQADTVTREIASTMVGRLRKVDSVYTLRQLKKELKEFDAKTGEWKN